MFSAVHHISLNCADADRDREFYVSVLGFEEMPRPDLGFKGLGSGSVRKNCIFWRCQPLRRPKDSTSRSRWQTLMQPVHT